MENRKPMLNDRQDNAYPLGLGLKPQWHEAAAGTAFLRDSGRTLVVANSSRRIIPLIAPNSLAPSSDDSIGPF